MAVLKYGLYLHGDRSNRRKVFGWTGPELQNQVFLVRGPYHMMSVFIRTLLTVKGEVIGRPEEGTDYYDLIRTGGGDAVELQARLTDILDDAYQQTVAFQQKSAQNGLVGADELLASYSLTELFTSTNGDVGRATVELTNQAGESVSGLLPLSEFTR